MKSNPEPSCPVPKPRSPVGSRATHGTPYTYARGCRCRTEDGLFHPPQTTGCTEAWREYRRDRERERSRRRKLEAARRLLEEAGEL